MLSSNSAAPTLLLSRPALDVVFWIAAAACLVSQLFILRAVWRVVPSVTGSPNVPAPKRASEVAWAILPALLMIGVFVGAWRLTHPSLSSDASPMRETSSTSAVSAPVMR